MKKILILAMAIVMCSSLAFAQTGGHIGIYSDVGYTDCNLVTVSGLTLVYVVHTLAPTAQSSQFKVDDTSGMTYLAENAGANVFIGSTAGNTIREGGAYTYVTCRALPWLLTTLQYFTSGFEAPCAEMNVVADPAVGSGEILVVACDLAQSTATGGKFTINGNETCPCVETVSTEETNWSRIKALYQ